MTLLTIAEYRALHSTALGNDALQLLLDAAEADIVDFAGDPDEVVEWFGGGQTVLALRSAAASITSIAEVYNNVTTTLNVNDYLLDPSGYLLYRERYGTNPRSYWQGRVVVTYAPRDTTDKRKVVQSQLVAMVERYTPGVALTVVGSWTEQYRQQAEAHVNEYQAILSQLVTAGRMLVV